MTICPNCNGWIGDVYINYPYRHECPVRGLAYPLHKYGVKCDICGSTAIDHTEIQCQMNRVIHKPNPGGQKKTVTKKPNVNS